VSIDFPEIITRNATSIGSTTARLNGEILELGDFDSVTAFFRYRDADDPLTWSEDLCMLNATSTGTYPSGCLITGLNHSTEYDFTFFVEGTYEDVLYTIDGGILSFNTSSHSLGFEDVDLLIPEESQFVFSIALIILSFLIIYFGSRESSFFQDHALIVACILTYGILFFLTAIGYSPLWLIITITMIPILIIIKWIVGVFT
jgi:hypothetical protein